MLKIFVWDKIKRSIATMEGFIIEFTSEYYLISYRSHHISGISYWDLKKLATKDYYVQRVEAIDKVSSE